LYLLFFISKLLILVRFSGASQLWMVEFPGGTSGEDILNVFERVSAALFQYRRQDRRYAKDLGCFGQANYVVDQQSPIDILHARELKGLMVDEDHRTVLWGEQVADSCVPAWHRNSSFLFYVDPWLAVIESSLLATVDSPGPTNSRMARTRPFEFLLLSDG
jgi:hypothetical protein